MALDSLDFDTCYRALLARDARFDGRFFTAVTSTGIYCRPVCPARTPARRHVRFFAHAGAAEAAGFRACRRCRPETSPGSPDWDVRADLTGRAVRLIADGYVDEHGVSGLARRLSVTERHLHRLLVAELGAGPLALARTTRLQTARRLLAETSMSITEIAFASGFASVRQFNDSFRQAYGRPPSALRSRTHVPGTKSADGTWLTLRLPVREPFDGAALLRFLAARAVPGVEHVSGTAYTRTVQTPGGPGVVELTLSGTAGGVADGNGAFDADEAAGGDGAADRAGAIDAAGAAGGDGPAGGNGAADTAGGGRAGAGNRAQYVVLRVRLPRLRGVSQVVSRCRKVLDLDADPLAIGRVLGADPVLARLVARRPGMRVPGAYDGFELAVRAVLGQQVSVAAARSLAGRLAHRHGARLDVPHSTTDDTAAPGRAPAGHAHGHMAAGGGRPADPGVTDPEQAGHGGAWHDVSGSTAVLFPLPSELADADLSGAGLPAGRQRTLRALAAAVAGGTLTLDHGADPEEVSARLSELPGVGPWTVAYVLMRAVGDPDAFPLTDLGLRRALARLGLSEADTQRWRPWRAYAALHLWADDADHTSDRRPAVRKGTDPR